MLPGIPQAFLNEAIPNEDGTHLSELRPKQQSKSSQRLAHGLVESVHRLGNRMFASNAQGPGFTPQYCKSKTCEKVAVVGFLPSPRKCLRLNLLCKKTLSIMMSLTELEETLPYALRPHHSPGVQQPRAGEARSSELFRLRGQFARPRPGYFSCAPSSDPNPYLLHCIGMRIK